MRPQPHAKIRSLNLHGRTAELATPNFNRSLKRQGGGGTMALPVVSDTPSKAAKKKVVKFVTDDGMPHVLASCLLTYLPTLPPTYLPTYLPSYLPTFLPSYLTLPYLTLPYLTLPYLTLPLPLPLPFPLPLPLPLSYLTFPYLTLPYLSLR